VVFSFDGDAAGRRAARKALDGALPFASDTRSVKFLFLPPEHDPDSFIREFGRDAFSLCISQSVPLSKFLIEAAREDCDLHSAEGRAYFASNARPLWMALPDGALKLQLLGEIADLVQLTGRELTDLWLGRPAKAEYTPRQKKDGKFEGKYDNKPQGAAARYEKKASGYARPQPRLARTAPTGRADHAARLLLTFRTAWDALSNEDHTVLCELPAPHGPLFLWLESQLHEHGPQSWVALREGLQGHESESLALRLMEEPQIEPVEPAESVRELRAILNRMLVERLKVQETLAIEAAGSDPQALERYRGLQARRRELESKL
jgi:DNA primase